MDLHHSSSALQIQQDLFGFAQLHRTLIPTADPADFAYLEQDGTGYVNLYFRGLRFGVDDHVPRSLVRNLAVSPNGTAWEFVCRQMLTHYGYHEDGWPALARQFLQRNVPT